MKFYIGVTDNDWFHFLARRRPDEVNFWRPRDKANFRVIEEYKNGREYYAYHGKQLSNLLENLIDRPSTAFLNWHRNQVYKG